jgi:hypothetical protein
VRPAAPNDPMRTPADDTLPPNDPDFFLLGKTEMSHAEAAQLTPSEARIVAASNQPFTGHMLDMPRGISDAAIQ